MHLSQTIFDGCGQFESTSYDTGSTCLKHRENANCLNYQKLINISTQLAELVNICEIPLFLRPASFHRRIPLNKTRSTGRLLDQKSKSTSAIRRSTNMKFAKSIFIFAALFMVISAGAARAQSCNALLGDLVTHASTPLGGGENYVTYKMV